jgi:hypothetical protein
VLSGDTPHGKSHYDKAIARFNRTRNERALARLHFFYGLALKRAGDETYETHWFKARELATKLDLREITGTLDRLMPKGKRPVEGGKLSR